jgi:preprotein translocase subunit YajC
MNFVGQNAFADTAAVPTTGSTGTPPATPTPPQGPTFMGTLMLVGPMFLVFYFLMIRPQQSKLKEQEKMVKSLQKGEEVITRAGIIGRIHGIAEKFITLEVDQNVRIKILKSQIETVLRGEQKA